MCNFLSFLSSRDGQKFYFDWKRRVKLKHSKNCDSHSFIAKHFGCDEDKIHKWEYNPITQELVFDNEREVFEEDESQVLAWCKELDFKTIVKPLIIKPIIDPRKVKKHKWSEQDMKDLKEWASVWASLGASVWASVRASVGDSLVDSVWASVRASVGASVRDSLRDSVGASVRDSVGASVRDSVWDSVRASVVDSLRASVGAYTSSFFDIPELSKYRCCVRLWERGFVPSFDDNVWRIHQGKDMKVIRTFDKDWNEICQN